LLCEPLAPPLHLPFDVTGNDPERLGSSLALKMHYSGPVDIHALEALDSGATHPLIATTHRLNSYAQWVCDNDRFRAPLFDLSRTL